jgi:Fic family protein
MATHTSESTARSHIKSLINKDYFEEKNVGNNVKMIKPKKANINALLPGLVL